MEIKYGERDAVMYTQTGLQCSHTEVRSNIKRNEDRYALHRLTCSLVARNMDESVLFSKLF